MCFTSLIRVDSYDGTKSASQSFGVFDYYFKKMWIDVASALEGVTDSKMILSQYMPAVISIIVVIANIAVTIVMAIFGIANSIKSLIQKKKVTGHLFVLIALVSNVTMGAVLMATTSSLRLIQTGDYTISNLVYKIYSISGALNTSISFLTIAVVFFTWHLEFINLSIRNILNYLLQKF